MPRQKPFKVLLIGDGCTDEYIYGVCERLNPEAPVPVFKPLRSVRRKGMAWNVRENLMSFGIEVYIMTNIEDIIKTRYIDEKHNQQLLRVDEEKPVSPMEYELPKGKYDAMVISDYDKGFITPEKLCELVEWFKGPVFIDSKKDDLPVRRGCFIKINQYEYDKLKKKDEQNVIVTRGGDGTYHGGVYYPTEKVNVFDIVGAGDTFLATLTYFYLLYRDIRKSIPYANSAATIAVTHRGTYILTKEDVEQIKSK